MRKLVFTDYSDPETRKERHDQKCINYIREQADSDFFVDWMTDYLYSEEWAIDVYEAVSEFLRANPAQQDARRQAGPGGFNKGNDRPGNKNVAGREKPRGFQISRGRLEVLARGTGGKLRNGESPPDPWDYRNLHTKVGKR